MELAQGSWLAAYLVLVGGAAQYTMGRAPSWLAAPPMSARLGWVQLACWNIGNVVVVAGSLCGLALAVDAGAAFLAVGLGIARHAVRRARPADRTMRVAGGVYRSVLLLLLISTAVGAVLAHLRNPA